MYTFKEGLINLCTLFMPKKEWRHAFRNKFIISARYKKKKYGNKDIYTGQTGNDIIKEQISKDEPCMICRYGSTELEAVYTYFKNPKTHFYKGIKNKISELSGFFPATSENLSRFSQEFLDLQKDIDILAIWYNPGEEAICNKCLRPDAKLITLYSLESFQYNNPWTEALRGKKVLIIHPFAETIEKQYKKRENLFANKDVLPEFELLTLKPPQGLADSKLDLPYDNWFEALEDTNRKIDEIDFDIAIIGAGAYGIFLAHHCKALGKKAVHMGGATQLLFGIIGKRWEEEYKGFKEKYMNEFWVRPSENEKPKGLNKVEKGCYW